MMVVQAYMTAQPSLRGALATKQSNYPHDGHWTVTLDICHKDSWIATSAYGLLAKTAAPLKARLVA